MAQKHFAAPQLRKTRIVCISDTHNQTPKLPKGDVLIHAGDVTNQGSYSELKKAVDWLEKAPFEAKIVVAGNHDITLDADFYAQHGSSWRWPEPQDPKQCRRLFEDSPSITYLEHQAASIYLSAPDGPHTCFKVFGSPCTPKMQHWAFQYEADEASQLWAAVPFDTDIVVTHTPPKSHCDSAGEDERSGCDVLLRTLYRVRPMLSVFGHIHGARGAERVRWNVETQGDGCLQEDVEVWKDPGVGNNKQSLVDLTEKGGRPLDNSGALTRHGTLPSFSMRDVGGQADEPEDLQPAFSTSTGLEGVADSEAEGDMSGGAKEYRQGAPPSDVGLGSEPNVEALQRGNGRRETVMINAAFMGPRSAGPRKVNKPIVVDVDLPVWSFEKDAG